jgi:acyl carrier protein
MTNREKLIALFTEIFLLGPREFSMDLRKSEVDTWDSLGVVSLAVGIQETFGYHLSQDEALSITSVRDIVRILDSHGVAIE